MGGGEAQTNPTDERIIGTRGNSKVHAVALREEIGLGIDPFLGHAIFVGMGDIRSGRRHFAVTNEALQV
jgi:hypothetical protein